MGPLEQNGNEASEEDQAPREGSSHFSQELEIHGPYAGKGEGLAPGGHAVTGKKPETKGVLRAQSWLSTVMAGMWRVTGEKTLGLKEGCDHRRSREV